MKVRVINIPGLCNASLVRSGNSNSLVARIMVPAAHGTIDELFAEREAFRQRVAVAWSTADEDAELKLHGFVEG